MNSYLKARKGILAYVPWLAIFCFIVVSVGMIVWAVGTNRAFTSTSVILNIIGVSSSQTTITNTRNVGIGAVVICMLYSLLMVFMALGRQSLERKIDEHGKAACGTWLWLAVEALLASIWWLVVFWFVFVIFGSCIWYGAAYVVWGSLQYTLSQVNATSPGNATVLPSGAVFCPTSCFNSAYFTYTISYIQDSCICSPTDLQTALAASSNAATSLHLTIAGAFVMWVGSSFLLMVSVAAFASTKRERELLLRAQRNAAESGASQFANKSDNPVYYSRDTAPLLGPTPQHVVQMVAPPNTMMMPQQMMPQQMMPQQMMPQQMMPQGQPQMPPASAQLQPQHH